MAKDRFLRNNQRDSLRVSYSDTASVKRFKLPVKQKLSQNINSVLRDSVLDYIRLCPEGVTFKQIIVSMSVDYPKINSKYVYEIIGSLLRSNKVTTFSRDDLRYFKFK